jgi:hypothetical protein
LVLMGQPVVVVQLLELVVQGGLEQALLAVSPSSTMGHKEYQ